MKTHSKFKESQVPQNFLRRDPITMEISDACGPYQSCNDGPICSHEDRRDPFNTQTNSQNIEDEQTGLDISRIESTPPLYNQRWHPPRTSCGKFGSEHLQSNMTNYWSSRDIRTVFSATGAAGFAVLSNFGSDFNIVSASLLERLGLSIPGKHIPRLIYTMGYTLSVSHIHQAHEEDLCQNYFLLVGITSGIAGGMIMGWDLMDIVFHEMPWTVLVSLLISMLMHAVMRRLVQRVTEKHLRYGVQGDTKRSIGDSEEE